MLRPTPLLIAQILLPILTLCVVFFIVPIKSPEKRNTDAFNIKDKLRKLRNYPNSVYLLQACKFKWGGFIYCNMLIWLIEWINEARDEMLVLCLIW
jgi:hypothetical protein